MWKNCRRILRRNNRITPAMINNTSHRTGTAILWFAILFPLAINAPYVSAQKVPAARCKSFSSGDAPFLLKPRRPLLIRIAGAETHTYSITVRAGYFLHVIVTQRGVDVAMLLRDQAGKKLVPNDGKEVVDSPNGTIGQEFISKINDKSLGDETYDLQVIATDKSAPAGCYEIVLKELRPAVPQDKDQIFAEDSFLNAFLLRTQDEEVPMLKAVQMIETALIRLPPSRNAYLRAELLNLLGYAYHFLGNDRNSVEFIRKALDAYRMALPLWRPLHDPLSEAVALNGIGNELDWMNRKPEALAYYFRAVKVWGADKSDPGAWGIGLLNIAFVYDILGDKEEAIDYYRQALPLLQHGREIAKVNTTLNKIAAALSYLGEYESAKTPLLQSLAIARAPATKNRQGEAAALKNLGVLYNSMGEKNTALTYLKQALPIYEELEDVRGQADTINSIGAVSAYLGATDADLYAALGLLESAKGLYLKVRDPDPSDRAATFNNIGGIHHTLKDYRRAIENYNTALGLIRSGILRHTHYASVDRGSEAKVLYNIARAEKGLREFSAARKNIEDALKIIESTRTNIQNSELRASYLASVKFYYDFYIELLMELDEQHPDEQLRRKAFEVSERSHARSLLDMLVSTSNLKINDPRNELLTLPPSLAQIQQDLGSDTLLLEYSLIGDRSFLWAITKTTFNTYILESRTNIEAAVDEVYNRLTARNMQIDFEEKEQKQKRIAKADEELPNAAVRLSHLLLDKVASQIENKRLLVVADGKLHYVPFAMLPLPSSIELSDELKRSFPTGVVPLIAAHEVVNIPSISVLRIVRQRARLRPKSNIRPVAVLADPVFDKDDERITKPEVRSPHDPCHMLTGVLEPERERIATRSSGDEDEKSKLDRLPLTRCEAKRISQYAPGGSRIALDFAANGALVKSGKLAKYKIIHFATHSRINNVRPELSAIVLSRVDRQGNPRTDGYIRAQHIYGLSFPADVVVLSSCKTGLGKNVEGEGLVGMTRSFLYAGASRVVVSLWDVNDITTTALMSDFYRQMFDENVPPAAALRKAQLDILKRNPKLPPYFWAAFIMQGEWR